MVSDGGGEEGTESTEAAGVEGAGAISEGGEVTESEAKRGGVIQGVPREGEPVDGKGKPFDEGLAEASEEKGS